MRKPLILIPLLLMSLQVRAQEVAAPKPTFNVSLERQAIRENDCVPVQIWFATESDQIRVSEVKVQLGSPSFLKFDQNPCDSKSQNYVENVTLAAAQPGAIYQGKLYLKTNPNISVGDYTLLFTSSYQWKSAKEQRHSIVSLEKPIKVNFLGSESVAGVPLGLAGLIVPGLFFWLVIRLFRVSWGVETGLGDKLIYSVVMSFVFVGLASLLLKYASWLQNLDVSSGISITKLIWLAGTGAGVGFIVGMFELWRRERRRRKAQAVQINVADDDKTRFVKLLKLSPVYNPSRLRRFFRNVFGEPGTVYRPETIVTLEDKQFIGSLGVRQADFTTLAGWFQVTKGTAADAVAKDLEALPTRVTASTETVKDLMDLSAKGDLLRLIEKVNEAKLDISGRDSIQEKAEETSGTTSTGRYTRQWPNTVVLQVTVTSNGPTAKKPLTVE